VFYSLTVYLFPESATLSSCISLLIWASTCFSASSTRRRSSSG